MAPYVLPALPKVGLCWMALLIGDSKVLGNLFSAFVDHSVAGQGREPEYPGGNLELGI